jgi:hypothetical protein
MPNRGNVRLTEEGFYQVLGLVGIRLPGPWWWHTEDLTDSGAQGAIFRCYEEGNDQELAYVLVADLSDDPDEPDITLFNEKDAEKFDRYLEESVRRLMDHDGRKMTKWMSSRLSETPRGNGLVSAYLAEDQGKERQYIDLRVGVRGRKVVIAGCFDVLRAKELAGPIFNALQNAEIVAPG